jgi:hypothetical protein
MEMISYSAERAGYLGAENVKYAVCYCHSPLGCRMARKIVKKMCLAPEKSSQFSFLLDGAGIKFPVSNARVYFIF